MAETIEGLVIEIEASADSATSQLEYLTARLSELKKVVSSSKGVNTFAKNFSAMANAVGQATSMIDTSKIDALRQFAESVSGISKIKVSESIGNQIRNIGTAIGEMPSSGIENMIQLSNALTMISTASSFRISPAIVNQLNRLAEFARNIQGQDFSSLNQLADIIAKISNASNTNADALRSMTTSMKQASSAARQATQRHRTFNTVLANLRVRTMAFYRGLVSIARGITNSLTVYGDYVEALNLYKMALGDAAAAEYEFAEQAQNILGIDLTQWMQAQGVFNALAKGFGVASDKAAIMSRNLTQLAYDISSFYNIDVEDAIQKVQSGFAGQIRPVRNLGYDLSQARLEAIALANGITKEVSAMTQAEKSQLRYVALMTQLTEVQGDLSRTLESPTNQLRLFNAQIQQAYRSIGMLFLPILNKVLPYLNAMVRVIKMIAEEIAALFGVELPRLTSADLVSSSSMGVDDLTDGLEEAAGAAEELKNTLASFDQINLITSKSGGSGSGNGGVTDMSDLGIDLPTYDFIGDRLENQAQGIAENIMKSIRPVVDFIKDSILWVKNNLDTVTNILTTLAVVTLGKTLLGGILDVFGASQKLGKYLNGLGDIVIGLQFSYMGGKDIAKGNILKGVIESAIGAAAAAYGGYLVFGPTGLLVGLSLSLAVTLQGIFEGDDSDIEELKKKAHDLFWEFSEGNVSVESLTNSWGKFVEQFYSNDFQEKSSVAKKLGDEVDSIKTSMAELQANYLAGNVTGSMYATNFTILYENMRQAVEDNLGTIGDAINALLDGPFGDFLLANGASLDLLREGFDEASETIIKDLDEMQKQLQVYNDKLADGTMTYDEFKAATDEIVKKLGATYDVLGMSTQATTEFFDSFKDVKVNWADLDEVKTTLETISGSYDDATKSIKKDWEDTEKYLNFIIENSTGARKEEAEKALKLAEEFYSSQQEVLDRGYTDLLESIENQKVLDWSKVYNEQGFAAAMSHIGGEINDLEEIFKEAYSKDGITRNETYWTQLIDMVNKGKMSIDSFLDDPEKWSKFAQEQFGAFNDVVTKELGGAYNNVTDSAKKFSKDQDGILKGVAASIGVVSSAFKTYTNDADYYARTYGQSTSQMASDTKDSFTRIHEAASVGMQKTTQEVEAKIRVIGNMIVRDDWCVDPMYQAMTDTANVLKQNGITSKFSQNAVSLMGGVAGQIKGSRDNLQRAYTSALTPAANTVVDIGVSIGEKIRQGMVDSTDEVKQGATELTKGMADAFNTFGDKAYRYFADLANLGAVVLGGMGATVSDSTFNNKFKAPKIKGYATGGFPDSADFFYANENGVPEYVGTLGGKTAVANNTDIVKGVSDGVYRAIASTGIQNDVKKIASKNGNVVFAPSAEAGKVMQQSVNLYNGTGGRY